jgi:predicted kinase
VEQREGGPSDATVDILSRQLERDAGAVGWHRLDAVRSPARIVADILALLPADAA